MTSYKKKLQILLNPPATKNREQAPTGKAGRNLPAAITVGVTLGALVVAMLLYLHIGFVFFVIVTILIGNHEFTAAVKNKNVDVALLPLWLGSIGMGLCAYFLNTQAVIVCYICTLMIISLWVLIDRISIKAMQDIAVSIFGLTWISLLGSILILLLNRPLGNYFIISFILLVIASDTGGYIFGVLFGKHPMSKRISPKKSWEGFFGSICFATMIGLLTLTNLGLSYIEAIVVAIVVTIASVIGDLCESLVKRDIGLKDMGYLLPGHGGVLDRVDSLLIAIIPFCVTIIFYGVNVAKKYLTSDSYIQVRPTDQLPEGATSPDAKPSISFVPQRKSKAPAHLVDYSMQDRKKFAKEQGFKAFRVDQLSRHYFSHFIADPTLMTDLPSKEGKSLAEIFLPQLITPIRTLTADKGKTVKYLWEMFDGARVESVLMGYKDRTTLCISSQAGCGMGCPFCATGQMGLTRNLSTAEIIEQVRLANLACKEGHLSGSDRVSNIVFMGMGEPLANYKNVIQALHCLIDESPAGFGMSARNITVSTVGLVPAINKLATEKIPVTLAVSLHAPDDDLRDELIPINSRFKVGQLLDAARNYFEVTGRRVSIEYALIKNMNDHPFRAQLLADELNARGKGWAHVNPIPLNPTPGSIWTASEKDVQETFVKILRNNGISTTIRDTRGADIDGACGQLVCRGFTTGVQSMTNNMFNRLSIFRVGYDIEQVDEFFKQAKDSYENVSGSCEFTAKMVRDVAFDEKRRGYDPAEVDAALDRLEAAFLQRERADHVSVNGQQAWLDLIAERATSLYPRLRRPNGEKFAHPTGRQLGYNAEEVDEFLQRVTDFFDDKDELTVDEVRCICFSPARKSKAYLEGPVDAYISRVIEVLLSIQ